MVRILEWRLPHRLRAPSTQRRVVGVGADVGEEAPAAFALGVGADFDGGGEVAAAAETALIHAATKTSAR